MEYHLIQESSPEIINCFNKRIQTKQLTTNNLIKIKIRTKNFLWSKEINKKIRINFLLLVFNKMEAKWMKIHNKYFQELIRVCKKNLNGYNL